MKVRWGILGCGRIAQSAFAPAIRWSENGELVAVASRTLERARERAAAVGAPRAHGHYEALLADEDVDAVYIGLPNGEHARWAIAAAEAGKHVLCDKSLALTLGDALAMRAAFRARGLLLVEAFMVRHHPQWALARALVQSGAIGEVRSVRAVFGGKLDDPSDHRWSRNLGGGALYDVTCYGVNVTRLLTGEEPARVYGVAEHADSGVDRSTHGILELPSGAVATVHGSLGSTFEQSVVVVGSRGRLILERPFVPHWDPTEVAVEGDAGRVVHTVGGANHFLHLVEHVAALVGRRGLTPAEIFPAEDGVANVATCVALEESFRTGAPVDVAPVGP